MTFPFLFGPFLGDKKIGWHGIRSVGPTFAIDLPSWGFFDKIRNEKLHYNMFSLSSMAHDTADTHKSCFEQLLLTTFFTDIFLSHLFSRESLLLLWKFPPGPTSQTLKFGNWSSFNWPLIGGWLLWMVQRSGTLHWWLVLDLAWVTMIYKRLWHIPGYGFSQKEQHIHPYP